MSRAGIALLAAALACGLGERGAAAFSPDGHEVLEALAYRDLISRNLVEGAGVSGREILATLIRLGVLAGPRCFDAAPDSSRCDEAERRRAPIDFWPALGSGSPDMFMSRQFAGHGQCYHFMSEDWYASAGDALAAGKAREEYQRCLRLATSIFDEVLRDPYAASARGRGIYILMHMLGDSYSHAHVERGGDGRIMYLKVWILRNLVLYPFEAHLYDARIHHAIFEGRDSEFVVKGRVTGPAPGKRCGDFVVPYEVPAACLSPDGEAAVAALVDLLVTTYVVMRHAAAKPASLDDDFARGYWQALVERRLAPSGFTPVIEKQHDDELDWEPNLLLGAQVHPDLDGGGWDAGLRLGAMGVDRRALPLIPLAAMTLGYGRFQGEGRWLGRVEASFLFPIWDKLGLGLAPLVVGLDCAQDFSGCDYDLLSAPARLAFFTRSLWIEVGGPEYSWARRSWNDSIGFTLGVAFDFVNHRRTGARPRYAEKPPAWDPPPLPARLRSDSPPSFSLFFEGGLWDSAEDNQWAFGVEVRKERDRHNRRGGLGVGLELAFQHGSLAAQRLDDARLVAGLRYYLVPDFVAVRLAPATLALGRWGDDVYFDVGAEAQLALSLAAFEVALGSPSFSYLHRDENRLSPWALRFTWRWR